MTAVEIVTLQNEIVALSLTGASARIIADTLNAAGSAVEEVWVVCNDSMDISKGVLTSMLSVSSGAKFFDILYGDLPVDPVKKKIRLDWINCASHVNAAHPQVRAMLDYLVATGDITTDEAATIKRLGERPMSRAEELFARKLTVAEIQEAM